MTAERKKRQPTLPTLDNDSLAAVLGWLLRFVEECETGRDRCREAYRLSGEESTLENARYYQNAIGAVRQLISRVIREQQRRAGLAGGLPDGAGADATGQK